MANQVSAIREGIRYQDLYSWCEILLLLGADSPYEYAHLEHPDACSVDDLTLFPKEGSGAPAKYIQLKWRTRQAELCSFEALVKKRGGTKSWLQQLHESWKSLRQRGAAEIWFVSNWPVDPEGLGRFLRSRAYQLDDEQLFGQTEGSQAGKAMKLWAEHLGIDRSELKAFCQDLRIRPGSPAIAELEEKIDDRMGRFGLRMGANPRAIALDAIGTWIEAGGSRKKVTAQEVRRFVEARDLIARPETPAPSDAAERIIRREPEGSLWVHAWAKQAFDLPPTEELDWTAHFSLLARKIPSQETWDNVLFPELDRARDRFSGKSFIDFRGKLPLTAALAVGFAFQEVAGYSFRATQPTRSEIFLWRSDAPPTTRTFVTHIEEEANPQGDEILVTFSIVGDARPDAQALRQRLGSKLRATVDAQPDGGCGGDSIRSAGDATALAHAAKELLKATRARYQAARIHLVLYAPAAFCLFLGQKLNSLRTILTYEQTPEHDYQRSVILETR
jgi:hypothetical protein